MSGEVLFQSTSVDVTFSAYLASDHVTAATGKTIAITISKNKGAFGNPSAGATNATEIANGVYYVNLSATDTGTLGPLVLRGAVALVDDVIVHYRVRSATNGDMTNLDAAVTTRMATYTQPTGFLAATFPTGTVANTTNITSATGITVSTNSDKTGYSLTQTFPTNFSAMAITAGGVVSASGNWSIAGDAMTLTAAYNAAKTASQAGDAMALTVAERNAVADALLARSMGNGRTVKEALSFLRNKWTVAGGVLTVYDTDDVTVLWTATIGSDAAALPVVSSDPA